MATSKKIKRNKKGDLQFTHTPFDRSNFRIWEGTHVFLYYSEEHKQHLPYFDIQEFDDEQLAKASKKTEFAQIVLYRMPDKPPYDYYIQYHNWQLGLLVEYFKEVFDNKAYERGYVPMHKYFRVILPKKLSDSVLNCINDNSLLPIRDLIFEIIATAQNIYVDKVFRYDNKTYEKRIRGIKKESQTAKEILENMFDDSWWKEKRKKPADLLQINFVFQNGVKKITDPWLADDMIRHFKKHLEEDLPYKNWKIEMDRYPFIYDEIKQKLKFKEQFAISLYNLFTKQKFFAIDSDKPYPNKLLLCIAQIMEFSLIPVGSEGETNEGKIRHIRNWLKRNTLEEKIAYLPVLANKKRLKKYFVNDFIDLASDIKGPESLSTAYYLSKRFDLPKLMNDFAHIAQCVREGSGLMSHQLFASQSDSESLPPDYAALRKLAESVKKGQKIGSLEFKIDGDDSTYNFTERLPLHFVEHALKSYIIENEYELETDLIKGKVVKNSNGSFQVLRENKLNLPEERFAVRFVCSFYSFLLKEAPPKDNEAFPSRRYYTIIALMLQKTWFFHHLRHDEREITAKVEEWHKLGSGNE